MGEVCWSGLTVIEEDVAAVNELEESVSSDTLWGAENVRGGLWNNFEKHRVAGEGSEAILFCSFGEKDGSPLVGEKFSVYNCNKYSSVRKKKKDVALAAGEERKGV